MIGRSTETGVIAYSVFALLAVWVSLRKRIRALEKRADAAGAKHEPDAGTYAKALLRIYEASLLPAASAGSGTHPCLYDRLLSAGVRPDFPRPKNPPGRAALLLVVLTCLVLVKTFYVAREGTEASAWRLALFGGAHQLGLWADAAHARGDERAEIEFLEASVDADPFDDQRRTSSIRALAAHGWCDRALRMAQPVRNQAENGRGPAPPDLESSLGACEKAGSSSP
jgi:hypothetical protein